MAECSICLAQLALIEEKARGKADATTEQVRTFLAERELGRRFPNRSPLWHGVVKTLSIAIDFGEIERLQDRLLSLFGSPFCESLSSPQSFAAAATLDEVVRSLQRLLQVSQANPTLAHHFWKTRLGSLRDKTGQIASIALALHGAANWERIQPIRASSLRVSSAQDGS